MVVKDSYPLNSNFFVYFFRYCSIVLIIVSSLFGQSDLKITKPKSGSIHSLEKLDGEIVIEWEAEDIEGKIDLYWSFFEDKNFFEISRKMASDKRHFWVHDFDDDKYKEINSDGSVYIKISKGLDAEAIVKIIIPDLASHGTVRFISDQPYKEKIEITFDGRSVKLDKDYIRKLGSYKYEASVPRYGQTEKNITVSAGKIQNIPITVVKTWGEVIFTSKNKNFNIIIEKNDPFTRQQILYESKQKKVYLEKGKYFLTTYKKDFKSDKKDFNINPNKPTTIPIKLVPEYAKARFTTKTDNVKIFLSTDSNQRGFSNTRLRLPEGKQTIVAKKSGFRETTMEVNLDPFKALNEFEIKMVREYGSIRIRSYPPGADILVDRKPINEVTPHTIDSIPAGFHSFMVKLDGYRTASSKKYITDRGSLDIYFPLKEKLGSLHVKKKTKNQKIRLTIDGTLETPIENNQYFSLSLEPGLHKIEIRSLGYEAIKETRNIYDDKEEFIRPKWDPILVKVNLKPLRQAPKMTLLAKGNKEYNKMDITGQGSLELPFGKYTIMAKAPKYEKSQKPFTINSNEQKFITPELTRKSIKKAKNYGWFPGAGLIYAEKKKLGISVMAGTLGLGSYYVLLRGKYPNENKKLNVLQADYLENTNLDEFAIKKARRDDQQEKVKKIKDMKDFSKYATVVLYGVNLSLTWKFHGL